jgi:hypothetical protein
MLGLHEYWDQAEEAIPPKIDESEERVGQYATKKKAMLMARLETQKTGRWHKAVPCHCWRDNGLTKKSCWTVVLAKH